MKRFLPLILLLFLSAGAFAQYKTIYPDRTNFFKYKNSIDQWRSLGMMRNSGEFIPLKIENTRIKGEDTLYSNYRVFAFTGSEDYECKATSKGYSWTGREIIMKKDHREIFINKGQDSIIFKKKANLNDSWTFCSLGDTYFEATVVYKQWESFKIYETEISDSVITIAINLKRKTDNNNISHPFNGKLWKVSKSLGFVKTYDLLNFPSDTNALVLAGTDKLSLGVKNLTEKEIYDFEVGDELHIKSFALAGGVIDLITRQTVIDKTMANDTVIYKFAVLENRKWKSLDGAEENFTVSEDTVYQKVAQHPDFNDINEIPCKSMQWYGGSNNAQFLREPSIMAKSMQTIMYASAENDSCFAELITFAAAGSDEEYWEGLGGPYYDRDYGILNKESRQLVYYKKGTKVGGTPLTFVLSVYPDKAKVALGLFPNPSSDRIRISSEDLQNTFYKIYNNEGREVLNGSFSSNEEQVDVKALREGMYSITILKEGGVVYTSRFVKQ